MLAWAPARDASGRHPERTSWRVVPVGQVIKIRTDDLRRDLLLVAYVQSAGGARFIVTEWPFRPFTFTAADDRGVSYQISWRGEMAPRELQLRPDPPHLIRWLDLTTAAGEPAIRIDLNPQIPVPDVTVTRNAHSPGELLLDVIAARILTAAARFSQTQPRTAGRRQFRAARPRRRARPHRRRPARGRPAAVGQPRPRTARRAMRQARHRRPRHHRAARRGPAGTVAKHADSPSREPQPPPAPGILAATVAELPELDGAKIAIAGLHHGERGTIMHLLATGVTLEAGWPYATGIRPVPVLWIRDSDGRWHATRPGPRCEPVGG